MGKSSINGQFSMAMLNNQRVYIYLSIWLVVENNGHIMMINTMVIKWLMMVNTNDWLVVSAYPSEKKSQLVWWHSQVFLESHV